MAAEGNSRASLSASFHQPLFSSPRAMLTISASVTSPLSSFLLQISEAVLSSPSSSQAKSGPSLPALLSVTAKSSILAFPRDLPLPLYFVEEKEEGEDNRSSPPLPWCCPALHDLPRGKENEEILFAHAMEGQLPHPVKPSALTLTTILLARR